MENNERKEKRLSRTDNNPPASVKRTRRSGDAVGNSNVQKNAVGGGRQTTKNSGNIRKRVKNDSDKTQKKIAGGVNVDEKQPVGNQEVEVNNEKAIQPAGDYVVEAKVKGSVFSSLFKGNVKDSVYSENKVIHRSGIDIPLLMIFIILVSYGVIMVFSASYAYAYNKTGNSYDFIRQQLIFVAVGIGIVAFIVLFYDWVMNKKMIPVMVAGYYFFMIALLVLVLLIGSSDGEAKRWIYIGPISLQPSEFMKGGLIMMMALYYSMYNKVIKGLKPIPGFMMGAAIPFILLVAPVLLLIFFENHASGMIIMFLIGVMMVVFGERSHWVVGFFALAGVTAVTAAIIYLINLDPESATGIGKKIIESYQWRRIAIWLRPEDFSLRDDLWQTAQGMYAIGSGGFMGVGFGQSRQKHMFVSQPQNDFIYTIICEELGFVGAVAVIVLFCALVWRGFVVGKRIPDRFSRYTVWGLTTSIAMQAFLNIAVVTNLIPNTGISLPFFSYGGSSIISLMIEVGLILAISRYAEKEA